jgi:hypothetical protein
MTSRIPALGSTRSRKSPTRAHQLRIPTLKQSWRCCVTAVFFNLHKTRVRQRKVQQVTLRFCLQLILYYSSVAASVWDHPLARGPWPTPQAKSLPIKRSIVPGHTHLPEMKIVCPDDPDSLTISFTAPAGWRTNADFYQPVEKGEGVNHAWTKHAAVHF